MIDKFLTDNSTSMRLARTILQGVIAALIVFVPSAIGYINLTPEVASVVTAVIMAILSPIMSLLKKSETITDEEFVE